jgi:ferritin-like metal-binding protein YciE
MARRRTKTSSTGRKKTATSRTTARKTASKRSTASRTTRKTTASRKTSGTRKKTSSARKAAGARKTTSSRKTASRQTAARKSAGTGKRASASSRRASTTRAARPAKELGSLQDVLLDQLKDLYSAEKQLVAALPKVAQAAAKPELREAFEHHLDETRGHVDRLEQVFGQLGRNAMAEHCKGMEGLLEEGDEIVKARGDAAAKDAALIAAAQRVEHYEIAAYGTARTLAGELGLDEARNLLNETLDEESNTDALLTKLATGGTFGSGINDEAAMR